MEILYQAGGARFFMYNGFMETFRIRTTVAKGGKEQTIMEEEIAAEIALARTNM